ncbi:MAG: hypothetical protein HY427_03350 [Candidatus Levybacteria bacterium]|nr:hypothetical protein [Candidatus Levybacteria bacterium]
MKFKLLAIFLLLVSCSMIFAPKAYAQFQNTNANYLNTNPDVPQNLNTYTQSVFINIATTLSCIFTGIDPLNSQGKCLGIDPATRKIGYVEQGGGLMAITGNLIASTFYIPVSTHDYGSFMASNFGIGEKAYAQGIGFQGLEPTLELWKAFRNITYMIFVLLFLIIGLGIMFRIKIDPRTVMTVQNQIPKIIIALALVTFSYAIAGFLIDLMYVSMYLIISVFTQQGIDAVSITSSTPFGAAGGIGGLFGIAGGAADTIAGIVASIFDGTIGKILGGIIGAIIGKFVGGGIAGGIPIVGAITTLLGGIGGAIFGNEIVGFIARIIAYLIIIIAIFSALLRLWFILIKSYIFILINVVFAPFLIARGLIPGQAGIGGWIRSMVSNLSVFPVTIIMFLLGKAFIEGFTKGTPGNPPFVPPMVGDFSDPKAFAPIIGLGIILMLPEVANMIRDALKQPEFKYTAAIGRSVGVGTGAINIPGQAGKLGMSLYYMQHIPGVRGLLSRLGRGGGRGGGGGAPMMQH